MKVRDFPTPSVRYGDLQFEVGSPVGITKTGSVTTDTVVLKKTGATILPLSKVNWWDEQSSGRVDWDGEIHYRSEPAVHYIYSLNLVVKPDDILHEMLQGGLPTVNFTVGLQAPTEFITTADTINIDVSSFLRDAVVLFAKPRYSPKFTLVLMQGWGFLLDKYVPTIKINIDGKTAIQPKSTYFASVSFSYEYRNSLLARSDKSLYGDLS